MKNLLYFDLQSDYQTFMGTDNVAYPNLAYVEELGNVILKKNKNVKTATFNVETELGYDEIFEFAQTHNFSLKPTYTLVSDMTNVKSVTVNGVLDTNYKPLDLTKRRTISYDDIVNQITFEEGAEKWATVEVLGDVSGYCLNFIEATNIPDDLFFDVNKNYSFKSLDVEHFEAVPRWGGDCTSNYTRCYSTISNNKFWNLFQ